MGLFSYTSVTELVFSMLTCVPAGGGVHVVFTLPTLDCGSAAYSALRAVLYTLLVMPVIGVPVGLIVALLWLKWPRPALARRGCACSA